MSNVPRPALLLPGKETAWLTVQRPGETSATEYRLTGDEVKTLTRLLLRPGLRADRAAFKPDAPLIGVRTETAEGETRWALWTNGCWQANDRVWRAALPVDALLALTEHKTGYVGGELPCRLQAALTGGGWDASLLEPVGALTTTLPDWIEAELAPSDDRQMTVHLTNRGAAEVDRGEGLRHERLELQVLLDGAWYRVPAVRYEGQGLNTVAIYTPWKVGETIQWTCDLPQTLISHAGGRVLPAGQYRARAFGCEASFVFDGIVP